MERNIIYKTERKTHSSPLAWVGSSQIRIMTEVFNVKDRLPDVECGSYLVYAPQSFPKNSRWLVAEYYADVKGFYSESSENFLEDVTYWCELPKEPQT